ncbi:hypothetical protein QR685DRAFT_447200 [Neurospora intermedia]|uniref:Uncharacterized protein n=1 Tax=Neurospora intermedia TaxID=5142 RepID=A0ABR3D6X5_NEUIN
MLLRHQNSFQGMLSVCTTSTAMLRHTGTRTAATTYSEPRPFAATLQGTTGHEQVSSGPDGQFKALALTHTTMKLSGGKGVDESRNSPSQDDKTKSLAIARQRVPLAGTIQN